VDKKLPSIGAEEVYAYMSQRKCSYLAAVRRLMKQKRSKEKGGE
jgi:hypothetical protein